MVVNMPQLTLTETLLLDSGRFCYSKFKQVVLNQYFNLPTFYW